MVDVVKWMFQLINMLQKLFLLEQRTSKTRPAQERKQTMEDWGKINQVQNNSSESSNKPNETKGFNKVIMGQRSTNIYYIQL